MCVEFGGDRKGCGGGRRKAVTRLVCWRRVLCGNGHKRVGSRRKRPTTSSSSPCRPPQPLPLPQQPLPRLLHPLPVLQPPPHPQQFRCEPSVLSPFSVQQHVDLRLCLLTLLLLKSSDGCRRRSLYHRMVPIILILNKSLHVVEHGDLSSLKRLASCNKRSGHLLQNRCQQLCHLGLEHDLRHRTHLSLTKQPSFFPFFLPASLTVLACFRPHPPHSLSPLSEPTETPTPSPPSPPPPPSSSGPLMTSKKPTLSLGPSRRIPPTSGTNEGRRRLLPEEECRSTRGSPLRFTGHRPTQVSPVSPSLLNYSVRGRD